jgi:hypothetical protein
MNAIIRKLAASVTLQYADSSQAQTLLGTDFALETEGNAYFRIDLSNNLSARNRGLPCFAEAQLLQRNARQLTRVKVNDTEMREALSHQLRPGAPLRLELFLDEKNAFSYMATVAVEQGGVLFTIAPEDEKAA